MSKKKKFKSYDRKLNKIRLKEQSSRPHKNRVSHQKSSHLTIKCSLKSILRDPQSLLPIFDNLVVNCNDIITETYQFIRLFCLHKYHNKQNLPDLADKNNKFILYCIRTITSRDNKGAKVN